MARFHLVRVGVMGQVGRFAAVDAARYTRGHRVVVRTARGLELGDVLAPPECDEADDRGDGTLLRGMTVEDQLLEARLMHNRNDAYEACRQRLTAEGLDATLIDVEHLFDGHTLLFYFLGDVDERLEAITSELAEVYDARVQFSSFVDAALRGCGPGCGTEDAAGNGCTSCDTGCAVAGACGTRRS